MPAYYPSRLIISSLEMVRFVLPGFQLPRQRWTCAAIE